VGKREAKGQQREAKANWQSELLKKSTIEKKVTKKWAVTCLLTCDFHPFLPFLIARKI
jgi:hypothetical protein